MENEYSEMDHTRKTGAEPIHLAGRPLGFDVQSFWQWMCSDLVSNATRGLVAGYLVARAVGPGIDDIRDE